MVTFYRILNCTDRGLLYLISKYEENNAPAGEYRYAVWTPSNPATLGTCQSVLIRGVASFFRGEFEPGSIIWDILKWPQYRGGLISGVLIGGSSLYIPALPGGSRWSRLRSHGLSVCVCGNVFVVHFCGGRLPWRATRNAGRTSTGLPPTSAML